MENINEWNNNPFYSQIQLRKLHIIIMRWDIKFKVITISSPNCTFTIVPFLILHAVY